MGRLKWMRRLALGLLAGAGLLMMVGRPGQGDTDPVPGPRLPPPPGTVRLNDGTLLYPDGTLLYPDGFFILPDGTVGYVDPKEIP